MFHDLGNSCFTFMAGKPGYDKSVSTTIVIDALARLGVSAFASGRNDLLVATRTGIARCRVRPTGRPMIAAFTTVPLLLDADLGRLAHYLNPDPKKLAAKGISSVRSRVANLGELLPGLDHEQVVQALCDAFFAHHGEVVQPEHISPSGCPTCPALPRLCPPTQLGVELRPCSRLQPPAGGALPLGRGRASFRRGEGGDRTGTDLQRHPGPCAPG